MKGEMKIPRKGHSSVYLNGKIFAVGGLTNHGDILDSIEFYNLSTDLWNFVEITLLKPLIHFSQIVCNPTDILLIGGNSIKDNSQIGMS